jgi:hypothetical protein
VLSQILQQKNTDVSKASTAKTKPAKPTPPPPPDPPKPVVIPAPDFINQPYYYDSAGNKLTTLETTAAQLVTKKKTLGLKGSKESLVMKDASSRVRFISKNTINFIIKTSGDVNDLTNYIKLYKFSSAEDKREVNISSKEGMLNDKEEQKGKNISFSVKMISPDNYMIQFASALEAGEYGFVWLKNMELKECNVFAFGIDWKPTN